MRRQSKAFLDQLLTTPSVSGYEQPAQAVVRDYIGPKVEALETDSHGNVTAVVNSTGRPRVMFAGHCDQIGFLVQHLEDEGFLRVSGVGGHDVSVVIGQAVTVWSSSGPLAGVIAREPIHLMSSSDRTKTPELHQLHVDTGLPAKDVKKLIRIGDPVTYDLNLRALGKHCFAGPGLDDKVGVYAVIEAVRLLAEVKDLSAAVHSVSTVQEEIGLRGAHTSAFRVDPEVGIAVDVTWATDQPGVTAARTSKVELGRGPVITRGPNINPVVFELLVEAAEADQIPYQLAAAPRGTGTDANAIQISRAGVAAGLVSIPNRYMHSPVEVCNLDDLDQTAKLLASFTRRLTAETDFTPR